LWVSFLPIDFSKAKERSGEKTGGKPMAGKPTEIYEVTVKLRFFARSVGGARKAAEELLLLTKDREFYLHVKGYIPTHTESEITNIRKTAYNTDTGEWE